MPRHRLAQLNIARMKEPLDSPLLADFVANLDCVNALAEASPGFVWRLQTDEGDATELNPLGEDTLVNLSVWEDVESLHAFVYRSDHLQIMRRRREWFERMGDVCAVLWWVPAGHRPDLGEALDRLEALRERGPHAQAFTFGTPCSPAGATTETSVNFLPDECPAV